MKKILFILLLLFCGPVWAKPEVSIKHGAVYVEKATYAEAQEIFEKYNFIDFGKRDLEVPRIYFSKLPTDWQDIKQSDEKNRMFIRILIPLILKINEDILIERDSVISLLKKVKNGEELSKKEQKFIEKKAEKYDIFSPNKEENRYKILLNSLVERVDELPAGFLIAIAGIYSDWGNSRLAVVANSLYREEIWYSNEGIAPEGVENTDFRYRVFSSLEECLRSFMHTVNSNITYGFVWPARTQARDIGRRIYGEQIIAAMALEGKLKNITGMLDFNLSYYKLNKTDIDPVLVDAE